MSDAPYEMDELDELLQRSDVDSTNYSAAIGTGGENKGHRKSHTATGIGTLSSSMPPLGPRGRPKRSHRKNMSSISELIQTMSSKVDLRPLGEDFRKTALNVRSAFVEELDDLNRGSDRGFFDMTATRSLGVIPDDLIGLGEETGVSRLSSSLKYMHPLDESQRTEEGEEVAEHEKGDGRAIVSNLLMLMFAVVAHSSNSTALHMLVDVSPSMKLFWRMSASYIFLLPFAVRYVHQEGFPKLSFANGLIFVSAAFFYTAQNLLFYTALDYTTIGNAVIYANSQALLLIVGKAFVGERIHVFEGLGVIVAFSGAILCSQDSERSSEASTETHKNAVFGDIMALGAAALGVAYLTVAKAVRSEMSVTFFITFVMFVGSLMVLGYIAVNPREELSFDMDPYHGVFGGFSATHHRFAVMAYLAIVVNMIGSMGFIRAMEFFDTVIIAVATLVEPLTASFIAYAFHAGLLPGPQGWVGNCLVFIGTLSVVYPSMGKGKNELH